MGAVDAVFAAIIKALKKGVGVTIVGFGTFKVGKLAAKTGGNSKTGKGNQDQGEKGAKFTAGKAGQDAVK